MGSDKRLYALLAVIVFCVVILCLSTSVGRDRRTYEVETQVYGVPAYQSDAARAIAAYERLMARYMDLTERNFVGVTTDIRALAAKLDAIDGKLTTLDTRLARVEKHLGIPPAPAAAAGEPNAPRDTAPPTISLPSHADLP
jgi:hypothetical protein